LEKKYTPYENKDKEFTIASMKKFVKERQEIDKFLKKIITPYIKEKKLKILDACSGIGHISYMLSELSPDSSFVGIDQTSYLVKEARKLCKNKKNILIEQADINELSSKYNKTFDITMNWKTISWLPYYEEILKSLLKVTKNHIFLSSLFYDGDIDFEIKTWEYQKEAGKAGIHSFYNIYSFPKFQNFLYSLGVKKVESYDFEIDIDIPKPPLDRMGTYTLKLENGKRIQLSGAVLMLWKIVRIDI